MGARSSGNGRGKFRLFEAGDVLRTHPRATYWGCAVVLSTCEATPEFDPRCHIGITPVVRRHEFRFEELDADDLRILEFETQIRVAPREYRPLRRVPCIGIYARRAPPHVQVIGRFDASLLVPDPLSFEAGDGTNGGWPLCGPVSARLGFEAVAVWRSIHDRERWLQDVEASRAASEDVLERMNRDARDRRKRRGT